MKKAGAGHKGKPLLYHRTLEQMLAYRKVPVAQKFDWLAAQMEFYHHIRPGKAGARRKDVR